MGATVVNTSVDTSNWSSQKPEDFADQELDKAIKAYKSVGDPPSVTAFPAMPQSSVKEFQAAIKTLESTISDLKKVITHQEKVSKALGAVSKAARSTSSKLTEAAKSKTGRDKTKYQSAASAAIGIGDRASVMQEHLK